MSNLSVKIIKDTLLSKDRYITIEAYYPRIIHSEVLRHRAISHSVASSRAIPTKKYIENYVNFIPVSLRQNEKGMSPSKYIENQKDSEVIYQDYFEAMKTVINYSNKWYELGLAKEQVNRILEPFSYIRDLMTFSFSDIEDVFSLRCHQDAQEEIRDLFTMIKELIEKSEPSRREVHFPYIDDLAFVDNKIQDLIKVSVARCARTSYDSNATGKLSSLEEDIQLYERLMGSKHLSPSEHILFTRKFFENQIMNKPKSVLVLQINNDTYFNLTEKEKRKYQFPFSGNLGGDIVQYRKILERNV